MIILDHEESFARFQRRCDPWLPDNIAEDEGARLRYVETGGMIVSDVQLTRMICRSVAKGFSKRTREGIQ